MLGRLQSLGRAARPLSYNAAELLGSLRSTGGLERILDFIFLGAGAANGYDSLGHFLRAEGVANICLTYAISPGPGCSAKLFRTSGSAARAGAAGNSATTSLVMARTLAVLKGATPAQALARYPGSAPKPGEIVGAPAAGGTPSTAQPVGGASAGTTYYTPSAEGAEAGGLLLNYLLGN